MKVTFIGLGIMGSRMAANLAKGGIDVTVYNRSFDKAKALESTGATAADDIHEAVREADVVITMLSKPDIVKEIASEFLPSMKKQALWFDSTTVDPSFSREMGDYAKENGIHFLDAPVAGSKQPAQDGELVFLVGGEKEHLDLVNHLLDLMGKKTIHMGPVGSGSSMKMLINLMLAQSVAAFSEAVSLGVNMGLEEESVYNILSNVPVTAPVISLLKEKLLNRDTSTNFPLKWMQKDLHLVSKVAYETGTPMPSANIAKEMFLAAREAGHADDDFSTLYQFLLRN